MSSYLVNFLVYAMAMVGLLFLCLMVYKKTMLNTKCTKKNDELVLENALNISQRKTLYVVKAGQERFLIAADAERTSFLAKLDGCDNVATQQVADRVVTIPVEQESFGDFVQQSRKNNSADYSEVMKNMENSKTVRTFGSNNRTKPIMKEMLRKLSEPILTDDIDGVARDSNILNGFDKY